MLKKINVILPVTWTFIITVLSLANTGSFGNTIKIPNKDKIVHFVFYFLFFILWYCYLNRIRNTSKTIILLLAIGYGALMEVLQAIINTNRSADFIDVIANSTGAFFGLLFVSYYLSNKKPI